MSDCETPENNARPLRKTNQPSGGQNALWLPLREAVSVPGSNKAAMPGCRATQEGARQERKARTGCVRREGTGRGISMRLGELARVPGIEFAHSVIEVRLPVVKKATNQEVLWPLQAILSQKPSFSP